MGELRETLDSGWQLVEQLQSFGASDPQPRSIEVNDTLEDLSQHLQRLAGRSVEVVQLLGATTGRIAMSRADLEELLSTLVLRAREAIRAAAVARPGEPVGAGRVVLVTSDGTEGAGSNGQPAAVDTVIEITDTGIPMTTEELAQIASGVRAAGDSRLARIHALVLKSGGTITADAGAEVGTTIRVRCPVAAPSQT
jgi:signal transduction histidine kinase